MLDRFGRTVALKGKRLWLFDMDGTIYEEERLFDGTLDMMRAIRESGGHYVFITNNSSKSVTDYIAKVNRLGIPAGEEAFFTSAQATVRMLRRQHPGAKVYCQGTRSLIRELREGGVDVTEDVEPVDVVLVGFDLELTSQKLRNSCQILTEQPGAVWYATNPDLVCPVSFGFVPDCGSICGMLQNATGREPIYIGKPEPTMIRIVMEKFGCSRSETVVVGDRLYTDIASGVNAGVDTVCVLTGEATEEAARRSPTPPTWLLPDIRAIHTAFTEGQ